MFAYLSDIWRFRYFWSSLVRLDLRTRYRRSFLGIGWSLLHPIAMTATICLVFHQLFHMDIQEFAPFLLAGLACWTYIVSNTSQGCQSMHMGEAYIRQLPAPLAIYPLRITLGATIHFVIALAIVFLMIVLIKGGHGISPAALLTLVPTLVLLFILCWSLATLAGFANVFFPDTQHLSEIGFQILFYMTPIMWEPRMLAGNPRLAWVLQCNPIIPFISMVREPIVHGVAPPLRTFLLAAAVAGVVATIAIISLKRLERTLIFYL